MTINNKSITADHFAWDKCHKIYLINSQEDLTLFKEYKYDIFPIAELEEAYENSCSLRFISNGNLDLPNVVNQFENALFS